MYILDSNFSALESVGALSRKCVAGESAVPQAIGLVSVSAGPEHPAPYIQAVQRN